MLHAHDMTRAVARGTLDLMAILGCSAAATFLARRETVIDDVLLGTASDFLKCKAQANAHVAAIAPDLLSTTSAHAAEERAEDIAHATEYVAHVDGLIATEALCCLGCA